MFNLSTSGTNWANIIWRNDNNAILFQLASFPSNLAVIGNDWTLNQWQHVAVTRSDSTFRIFQDGTQTGTASSSVTISNPSTIWLARGATSSDINAAYVGYIDDFRLTVDTARYTANFDVPTEAFPDS